MPRRDDCKDRQIVRLLLQGVSYRQIQFLCKTTRSHISVTKHRYLSPRTSLVLNARGERLMEVHEQLKLKLGDPN